MFRNIADHPIVLVVLIVLVVALFGAKRLPDAARGLGRSMRIFKSEVKEMKNDDTKPSSTTPAAPLEGTFVKDVNGHTTTPTDTTATGGTEDPARRAG